MATKQSAGAHMSAPTRAKGRAPLFAAVDLGTNNCRLLIAERSGASFRVVDSFSRIVRLGEGLAANGELSGDAMDRAVDALRVCKSKILRQGVARTRCIATQACRAAGNGDEFLARVQDEVGIKLDTISPKDEAKYAVLGSLDLIDQGKDFALVVDIGGGSTELSWVDARAAKRRGVAGCAKRPPILGWASFPIGVVTLSEAHPDLENGQYDKLVADVRGKFAEHDAANRFGPLFEAGRGHLLGTSGTVTSLAGVHLNLKKYARSRV
ncbi:MAG: Ppx/GppA family phosphatase, partial [Pseudomonadota bacterium]